MTDKIEIEIDGKILQASPTQTVIQVADEAGIYIPRFCYHKQLTVAANCRMCLVDVEKSPKPMPACAMPVMPGMKVFTKSPKAIEAQRAVMEFLLINHPLDCPICDQGGECELQDLALGYGSAKSHFCENKRAVADENIGPLVETEMTRCIQCTRCVRFGDEIAGMRELGLINRGEDVEITTYVKHTLQSELSGNIIDLCPVGALTAKPSRYRARAWELTQAPSISPHDCVGSNVNVHSRRGKVMRVVSREKIGTNDMWIADRDRFSYEALAHADRIDQPMVKLDGRWEKTDWLPALDYAVGGLRRVLATSTGDQLGALASSSATLEELYLLQKIMRGLGSSNVDHRLRQSDFRDQSEMPLMPGLGFSLAELDQADSIFLIGSNIQKEQPVAAIRLRKAYLKGAAITAINMMDYRFHFRLKAKKIVGPTDIVGALAAVAKHLSAGVSHLDPKLKQSLDQVTVDEEARQIAETLEQAKNGFVLLGALAFNHPQASVLRRLANFIAQCTGAKLGFLTEGANTAAAWLSGMVPHRRTGGKINTQVGLNAQTMLERPRKGYLLFQCEPELDCANPLLAASALKQADFVVAFSSFRSPLLEEVATVILPISPFTETAGTYINASGEWQSFKAIADLHENSQPGWKVLSSMANLFQLPGFRYDSAETVREEVKTTIENQEFIQAKTAWKDVSLQLSQAAAISRISEVPIYSIDSLVRRAEALQETQRLVDGDLDTVRLHPDFAASLGFEEGEKLTVKQKDNALSLKLILDKRVPLKAAWIASGIKETIALGEMFAGIELSR